MTCICVLLLQFAMSRSTATFAEEDHMRNAHFAKEITNQNSRELHARINCVQARENLQSQQRQILQILCRITCFLLLLMLILCCQRTTMYHSYCLDFLLFCFRFTRSCKHVIRTPLMFTSCNMTSSTLSHRVGARASPFTGEASCEIDKVFLF